MDQNLKLKKLGFGKVTYPKVVDIEFSQLIQSVEETSDEDGFVTPKEFFNMSGNRK